MPDGASGDPQRRMGAPHMAAAMAWILGRGSRRHLLLTGLALLTALAAWPILGLRVDGDMTALLRDDDPVVQDYEAALHDLPQLDALVLLCESQGSDGLEAALGPLPGVATLVPWPDPGAHERLIQLGLTAPPSDISRTREILARIRARLLAHGAHCRLGGVPAFLVESSAVLNRDLLRAAVIATLGIMAFFLTVYRGLGMFLLTLVPVAAGIVWGLGAATLVSHELTLLAAMVPTLLVGIGIDYGIHLAQAARVALRSGRPRLESIVEGWRTVARPISVGALTTVLAFAALMGSGLRGLFDMGRTGALVTAGVYLANMLLMPVLLMCYPLQRMARETPLDRGLAWVSGWARRAGRGIAWGALLISLLALYGISRLVVQADTRSLEAEGLESRAVQERLSKRLGAGDAPLVIRADAAASRALLRAYQDQPGRWPAIRSLAPAPVGDAALVLAYPAGDPFEAEAYAALTRALRALAAEAGVGDYRLSGSAVVNHRIDELLGRDWQRVLWFAGASTGAVLILLMGARAAALVWMPLAAGALWTAGGMGWLGTGLSVMSAAVFPLLFGLGIDDGVHVILYGHRRGVGRASLYRDIGVALVATTATTVIAMGAFAFSATRGLVQFGIQAATGLTFCLLVSLLVLPVFMRFPSGAVHVSDGR